MGAKLTDEQVQEIRLRHAEGERPRNLAAQFGLSKQHVYQITKGERRGTAPVVHGDLHIGRPEFIGVGQVMELEKDPLGRRVLYWYRPVAQDRFQAGEDIFDGLVPFFERRDGIIRAGWSRPEAPR